MKVSFLFLLIFCTNIFLFGQESISPNDKYLLLAGKKFNDTRRALGVPILPDELQVMHRDDSQIGWRNPKNPTEVPQYYHKTCFIKDSRIVKESSSFTGPNKEDLYIDYVYFDNSIYSYGIEKKGFTCRIVYNHKDGAVYISASKAFALLNKWGIKYK